MHALSTSELVVELALSGRDRFGPAIEARGMTADAL
jgi:hypothetical protein